MLITILKLLSLVWLLRVTVFDGVVPVSVPVSVRFKMIPHPFVCACTHAHITCFTHAHTHTHTGIRNGGRHVLQHIPPGDLHSGAAASDQVRTPGL